MIECEVFFYQGSATYKQRPIYTYLYKKYLLGKYILYCTLYRIKKMWMFLTQCIFLSRRCYFKAIVVSKFNTATLMLAFFLGERQTKKKQRDNGMALRC